jgi:hypothetical protein
MPCEFEEDAATTFPGLTLFSKQAAPCLKPTAVYFPRKFPASNLALDVVLWLHGFYVKDHKFLFHGDPAQVREQVRNANKDVVLIAPFLGYEYVENKKFAGDYSVDDLKAAKWGERYLDDVLKGIARFHDANAPPALTIRNLVIACHSGGGSGMRNLVGSLGKYQPALKACWGFDCLYGANATPDDATFWFRWASGKDGRPLDIVFGPSTLPQSVKLNLMGRGIATPEGDRASPRRPQVDDLHVSIGHYDAYPAFGQMVKVNDLDPGFVDDVMMPPPPKGAPPRHPRKPPPGEFVQQAADNLSAKLAFPAEIHYVIARTGFLSRLSNLHF